MTTPAAAEQYRLEHLSVYGDRKPVVFNPLQVSEDILPRIYGFNNGGETDWYGGILIAEDGTILGSHVCSHEPYMPFDLGIIEGAREDRHVEFRKHYPNGYVMEFVSYNDVKEHTKLTNALAILEKNSSE